MGQSRCYGCCSVLASINVAIVFFYRFSFPFCVYTLYDGKQRKNSCLFWRALIQKLIFVRLTNCFSTVLFMVKRKPEKDKVFVTEHISIFPQFCVTPRSHPPFILMIVYVLPERVEINE
ncbi:hypothetical protein HAX54_015507 [Datura stramonium]|uniref:Secreted protein n=1 Tax=Datura stramonium TaxID=4076 RepID=A0ABS8Y415_DATST|nr:hypothetical protein [Datura stramonium]